MGAHLCAQQHHCTYTFTTTRSAQPCVPRLRISDAAFRPRKAITCPLRGQKPNAITVKRLEEDSTFFISRLPACYTSVRGCVGMVGLEARARAVAGLHPAGILLLIGGTGAPSPQLSLEQGAEGGVRLDNTAHQTGLVSSGMCPVLML